MSRLEFKPTFRWLHQNLNSMLLTTRPWHSTMQKCWITSFPARWYLTCFASNPIKRDVWEIDKGLCCWNVQTQYKHCLKFEFCVTSWFWCCTLSLGIHILFKLWNMALCLPHIYRLYSYCSMVWNIGCYESTFLHSNNLYINIKNDSINTLWYCNPHTLKITCISSLYMR